MKAWLDFLPLLAFFIAYKVSNVFTAAAVLIIAVTLVYSYVWWRARRLETSQWLTVGATIILGGLTLLLHDEKYLQWKAPVVYVVLACVFIGSQFIGEKPLIKRMMEQSVTLSATQWRNLNLSWAFFCLLAAAANAFVVVFYTAYWVDFKLFGSMAMTFSFVMIQGVWLMRKGALKDSANDSESA